jgi:hypothetical protein
MNEIGAIKYAKELGLNDYSKRIWYPCKNCGKLRWATFKKGEIAEYCQSCSQKIGKKHTFKRKPYKFKVRSKYTCKVCKKEYPATKQYFLTSKFTKSGLILGRCKKCVYKIAHKSKLATAKGRLNHNISCYIRNRLGNSKDYKHWELLVGYSIHDLMKHLESKFKLGMTWENYGKWEIDHIKPVSAFNFSFPDDLEFKQCWSLSNLQPLWDWENNKKNAKY